jgi:rRNA processing protein Krr1/Pno1
LISFLLQALIQLLYHCKLRDQLPYFLSSPTSFFLIMPRAKKIVLAEVAEVKEVEVIAEIVPEEQPVEEVEAVAESTESDEVDLKRKRDETEASEAEALAETEVKRLKEEVLESEKAALAAAAASVAAEVAAEVAAAELAAAEVVPAVVDPVVETETVAPVLIAPVVAVPPPFVAPVAAATATVPIEVISTISPTGDTETISIAPDKVGQIIGTKGAVIQDMQTRTGAKIFLNQDFPAGVNRQVSISGTPAQVKQAGDLIRLILEHGPTAIHVNSMSGGPIIHTVVECPQTIVGRVIGSSGATIKELQSRSGAKIQIDQNFPEGVPRKINVSGTQTAIALATQLIAYVMENGPTLPPLAGQMQAAPGMQGMYGAPAIQSYAGAGGLQHQVMDCAKAFVGKIIGRGGEVITMIQQRSGAKVQIDQNVAEGQPCKVNMSGSAQNLAIATQLVQEAMLGVKPQGGMGQQGGYGGEN